jgi:uncharacterized RDD family membrane protein YckC
MAMHYSDRQWHRGGAREGQPRFAAISVLERIIVSNENWNDPANTPSQPQPPYGQPSAPDPQAPPATPAPEGTGTGSYTSPNYTTPSYTPPAYGTPDAQPASPASSTPSYSAPDPAPTYGAPAGGGYTAPDPSTPAYGTPAPGAYTAPDTTTPAYGAAPSYGTPDPSTPSYGTPAAGGYTAPDSTTPAYGAAPTYGSTPDPSTPAYGSTPSYGAAPAAGSYGSAPDPAAGSYGSAPDPSQGYGAAGGYGQSQPGQYGATGYGQTAEGYQDPNAAYGATPAPTYGAGYPSTGAVSSYGYDSGYASATPELASFGNRALGWLIDWVAPAVVVSILGSILSNATNTSIFSWILDLVLAAFIVWNSGMQAGTTGYSLGRRIAKTKLVSEATGQPIGSSQGILRAVSQLVMNILCGLPGLLSWLFPLWDAKRQTLADKIVKSVVVSDPNAGAALQQ